MKLVSFSVDGKTRAGILEGDGIVDLGASMKEVIATGAMKRGAKHPTSKVKLRAPIADPAMVLSVGMNYHEHLKEMKTPAPEKPAAFTKSVASIIASGEPIKVPPSNPSMLDWEGEFSVVIARPCHRVKAAQALDYVFGYTLVNVTGWRRSSARPASWARSTPGSTTSSARCSRPSVRWDRASRRRMRSPTPPA
jgi:2-keto-4-pentenoate hydratase/2-oxohepta-3-ene-1,7-dioic acid hydratase in catechol pathway